MMVGTFSTFTYVAPFLVEVSAFAPEFVALLLLGFGVGATAGLVVGGHLADMAPSRTLVLGFPAQFIVYGAIFLLSKNQPAMVVLIVAFGAVNFAMAAVLQHRVLQAVAGAPDLASTLISSAFNFGIAAGASAGAIALSHGFGYAQLPLIGVGVALANAAATVLLARLDRPAMSPG